MFDIQHQFQHSTICPNDMNQTLKSAAFKCVSNYEHNSASHFIDKKLFCFSNFSLHQMSTKNKTQITSDPKTLPYPLYRRICKGKEGFKRIAYLVGRELT